MLPSLEKFILAGEVLTKKLVRNIKSKFENSVVINGYGPTEGTVLLASCEISEEMMKSEKSLPIGKLLPGAKYEITKEDGTLAKSTEPGELVVVSESISSGYYKNKEQTDKAFFKTEDGKVGYKTGDLVFEENGLLYYVARKDFQIK